MSSAASNFYDGAKQGFCCEEQQQCTVCKTCKQLHAIEAQKGFALLRMFQQSAGSKDTNGNGKISLKAYSHSQSNATTWHKLPTEHAAGKYASSNQEIELQAGKCQINKVVSQLPKRNQIQLCRYLICNKNSTSIRTQQQFISYLQNNQGWANPNFRLAARNFQSFFRFRRAARNFLLRVG